MSWVNYLTEIIIPKTDKTYVHGRMLCNINRSNAVEPYYYIKTARSTDPDGSLTLYYKSKNLFVVCKKYDGDNTIDDDNIIRIVRYSTHNIEELWLIDNGYISYCTVFHRKIREVTVFYKNQQISNVIFRNDDRKTKTYRDNLIGEQAKSAEHLINILMNMNNSDMERDYPFYK
jgi:hypothetical protein